MTARRRRRTFDSTPRASAPTSAGGQPRSFSPLCSRKLRPDTVFSRVKQVEFLFSIFLDCSVIVGELPCRVLGCLSVPSLIPGELFGIRLGTQEYAHITYDRTHAPPESSIHLVKAVAYTHARAFEISERAGERPLGPVSGQKPEPEPSPSPLPYLACHSPAEFRYRANRKHPKYSAVLVRSTRGGDCAAAVRADPEPLPAPLLGPSPQSFCAHK